MDLFQEKACHAIGSIGCIKIDPLPLLFQLGEIDIVTVASWFGCLSPGPKVLGSKPPCPCLHEDTLEQYALMELYLLLNDMYLQRNPSLRIKALSKSLNTYKNIPIDNGEEGQVRGREASFI